MNELEKMCFGLAISAKTAQKVLWKKPLIKGKSHQNIQSTTKKAKTAENGFKTNILFFFNQISDKIFVVVVIIYI